MSRTLGDFQAAHDPTHNVGDISTRYVRDLRSTTRFIVTAAQNATPVNPQWWAVLQSIASANDAEILVIPLRYKNPTSAWTGSQRNEEYWVEEVRPYLWNARIELNKNLIVLGDIKIQPTAVRPLTGNDALSHASSGIIGHTKLQLRTIATPSNRMPKILTTTGACTVPNYTDSRAGRIGEFHHSLSAVMVEIDGPTFHLRQLHFDKKTSSCTDIGIRYFADRYEHAPRALALVMGDTHVDFVDPGVEEATWGLDGIIATCGVECVVWNDTLDSYSCSPHHLGNPFVSRAKQMSGRDNVQEEVKRALDYIDSHRLVGVEFVVVPSNHDDMLSRWVKRSDWRSDPVNAPFYLETALAMVRGTTMGPGGAEYPDPFIYWLREANMEGVRALDRDESFMLGGVEVGMHGDVGPNGARGSIGNLRRIGTRSIIGHSHQPGIDEGCYQTGTSSRLRLEYNHGPSGWLNTHCLLNADGKRQLINIIDGRWRV